MFITQHMTRNPVTVSPETLLPAVREILQSGKFRHLPVVDGKKHLVGLSPTGICAQPPLPRCFPKNGSRPAMPISSKPRSAPS
jgi:CBS-domain-containing membrane protein